MWRALSEYFEGEPRGKEGNYVLKTELQTKRGESGFNALEDEEIRAELLGYDLINDTSDFARQLVREPLEAFVHETARELIKAGQMHLAERRSIVTIFAMIEVRNVCNARSSPSPSSR